MPILNKAGGRILLASLSNPATAADIMPGKQAYNQTGTQISGTCTAKYLPALTNAATAADIAQGKQAINASGAKVTGTAVVQGIEQYYITLDAADAVSSNSGPAEIYIPFKKRGGSLRFNGYMYLGAGAYTAFWADSKVIALPQSADLGYLHSDASYSDEGSRLNNFFAYIKTFSGKDVDTGYWFQNYTKIWYDDNKQKLCYQYWRHKTSETIANIVASPGGGYIGPSRFVIRKEF